MKFYIARDENGRRTIHHRQDDAKAEDKNFEKIDIPTDKSGLMAFVQKLYSELEQITCEHDLGGEPSLGAECLNCGVLCEEPVNYDQTPVVQPEPYSTKSVRFEDEFDNMPLAQQLHFASRAMENARDQL